MVQAQRPHFAVQPSEAYTWFIRARGATPVTADLISPSLRTLQLQTITAHSWLYKRARIAINGRSLRHRHRYDDGRGKPPYGALSVQNRIVSVYLHTRDV
jgi:hypothetical protein